MPHFVLTEVKRICGIDQTDATYDPLLNELGAKADKRVESDLSPYASVIPLAGTELVTASQTELANLKTAQLYGFEAHDEFLHDKAKAEYKEALATFIAFLRSIPSSRATIASYSTPYRSSPIKDE